MRSLEHVPQRVLREIRLAARLQHRILLCSFSGEAAGQLLFTMPCVEGARPSRRSEARYFGRMSLHDTSSHYWYQFGYRPRSALAFGRAGHTVYATMRDPGRSPELHQIATREGQSLMVVPMDVDSDASVRAAFDRICERGRGVDVLINNAGIAPTGSVEQLPLEVFRAVMETNLVRFAAFRLCCPQCANVPAAAS